MKLSKTNSSSFRYFLAGLKPFGKMMFWAPLAVLGLLCFAIWQYKAHPEWLSRSREQPKSMEDSYAESEMNLSPDSPSTTSPFNQPINPQTSEQSEQRSNNPNSADPSSFLRDNTQTNLQEIEISTPNNSNQSNADSQQKPSLLQPLLSTPKTDRSVIEPSPIQPVKPAPLSVENHLQKAINQKPQEETTVNNYPQRSSNTSTTLPELNINNRTPSLPGTVPQNNNYSTQPLQPSPQPYQVPYNNYNYSTQPQPQTQQTQPSANSFQVPYNNYPTQSPTNNISGQNNTNSTSSSQPVPQIQPSFPANSYY